MKQSLLAIAALAVTGSVSAQSSVTIGGNVDIGVSHYSGGGSGSVTKMVSGASQSSRLTITGREDLGGGAYAGFTLEAQPNAQNGSFAVTNTNNQASGNTTGGGLTFARKSYVNLGGNWGELRLGRDYHPAFWNLFAYDPFRVGVGLGNITTHGTTVTVFRASNSIGYFTPGCTAFTCKGFFGQAMVASGNNPSNVPNSSDGRLYGARVGYGGEKWDAAFGHSVTRNLAVADYTQTNLGGSVDVGPAHIMALWAVDKTGLPNPAMAGGTKATATQIGAWIYAGQGYIPVAFTHLRRNDAARGSADKVAVGYVYTLSKRTALYATYAHITNKNSMNLPVNAGADVGPTPLAGRPSSGYDIGIRHNF